MATVSISEAARLAGVSRNTIYKHRNQGKLSVGEDEHGNPSVDTSELLRVYKKLNGVNGIANSVDNTEQNITPKKDIENSAMQQVVDVLREQIRMQQEMLDQAAAREDRLIRHLGDLAGTIKLIEDKTREPRRIFGMKIW